MTMEVDGMPPADPVEPAGEEATLELILKATFMSQFAVDFGQKMKAELNDGEYEPRPTSFLQP